MVALEFVRTYLDNLLCITKGSLDDHLSKQRKVLIRLRHTGLKVNAAKCSFCGIEKEYIGYVLTRDGVKHQPKKVQAILTLTLRQNIKQLCRFLGMVQYYRDHWSRWSEMLSPLTDLVGECGHTKATKARTQNRSRGIGTMCIRLHLTM
jgi:hypothetical protein